MLSALTHQEQVLRVALLVVLSQDLFSASNFILLAIFFLYNIFASMYIYKVRYSLFGRIFINQAGILVKVFKIILCQATWGELTEVGVIISILKGETVGCVFYSKNKLHIDPRKFGDDIKKIPVSNTFISFFEDANNLAEAFRYCPKEKIIWIRDKYCPQEIFDKYKYRNYWEDNSK